MATVIKSMRLTARAAAKYASPHAARRTFTATAQTQAASNFTMPALSPTMTEGNIAQWQVKEGDSFSAGDVLLEIETDKATMDVEAQEDGILMKIMSGNGSKAVQVGSRIAVIAEAGDDISSMELPKDDTAQGKPAKAVQEEKKSMTGKPTATEESAEKSESKNEAPKDAESKSQPSASKASSGKARNRKYPLYPSVQHLLHENGISDSQAEEISASGPNGRLLKGDVLAYLGKISKDYPAEASARLKKLSHLDLSNIQIATPPPKAVEEPVKAAEPAHEPPKATELALPISLAAVLATQKRMQDSLHTSLPLSVFIARASELANEELPLSAQRKPDSEELFNAVLGIPFAKRTSSKGRFVPQVSTFDLSAASTKRSAKKADIFDILGGARTRKTASPKHVGVPETAPSENLFRVTAKSGEEERAMVYLERMKYALEKDPGRLVL